jgi:hypothetical protein
MFVIDIYDILESQRTGQCSGAFSGTERGSGTSVDWSSAILRTQSV